MICLVTDRRRLSPDGTESAAADRLVELVAAAASAGVGLIQIRERDLGAREMTSLVRRCVEAVGERETKVVVNDRADVALAAGAHGVHLRSDSMDALAVRRLFPADAIVGRSVHRPEEAAAASHGGGIDYLILGTLFQTLSKDPAHPLMTLEDLRAACRLSTAPILAIGGMTVQRAAAAARAGAGGIAAIGLFIPPAGCSPERHVHAVVADLRRAFDTCGAVT
jgi:thiamine-phosphate diphosphorylase